MMEPMARTPKYSVTVDTVLFTIADGPLETLVIRRKAEPFKGRLALPGGFVEETEDLAAAAKRELTEETGISPRGITFYELGAYGKPKRDPRGRTISVVYVGLTNGHPATAAGSDASAVEWIPTADLLRSPRKLGFDHPRIIADALEDLAARVEHSTIITKLCPKEFTISQLRQAYETIWDTELDPRNFHRKILSTDDLVVDTGTRIHHGGRPARLYRAGSAERLHPALVRS